MHRIRLFPTVLLALVLPTAASAQRPAAFTRADSIRGSVTPERAWWDLVHYDLAVRVSPSDSTLVGSNTVHYRVTGPARELQLDLMPPLVVDSVVQDGSKLEVRRDGNAFYVRPAGAQTEGSVRAVTVHWHGRPRVAVACARQRFQAQVGRDLCRAQDPRAASGGRGRCDTG